MRTPLASAAFIGLTAGFVALAAGSIIIQLAAPGAAVAGTAVGDAAAFIVSQQRDDGGFGDGEAGYAGFETPDALLAIGAYTSALLSLTFSVPVGLAVIGGGYAEL